MTESGGTRRTKRLLIGAAACFVGIPVSVVLHGLLDALSGMTSDIVIVGSVLGFLSVVFFFAAIVVCPAGTVILLVAALLDRLTTRWKTVPRRIMLFLVPAVAAVAAVTMFNTFLSLSNIERDSEAGFNGSFEVVKSGLPANWYVHRVPLEDGDVEISYDSDDRVDGTQSLKLLVHRVEGSRWRGPGLFQVTDAVEGQTYRVSFWLKNRGCRIRILIDSEFPESREPRNPITQVLDVESTGLDTWQRFDFTYTVPEHYRDIRFELNVLAPGTVWVDDVRIEPSSL